MIKNKKKRKKQPPTIVGHENHVRPCDGLPYAGPTHPSSSPTPTLPPFVNHPFLSFTHLSQKLFLPIPRLLSSPGSSILFFYVFFINLLRS